MRSLSDTADLFLKAFGYHPTCFGYAPGRVNIIGTHTDYNCGRVISAAVPFGTTVAISWNDSQEMRLISDRQDGLVQLTLGELSEKPAIFWTRYVVGTLVKLNVADRGVDIAISSDLPMCRGLASSAALTVSTASAAMKLDDLIAHDLATACQQVEHQYIGVQCGLLDQVTALNAQEHKLLLVDCLKKSCEHVDFPNDLAIVICDSGISRSLAHSQYNFRRAECQQIAKLLGYGSLREIDPLELTHLRDSDPELCKRADHVFSENQRVCDLAAALSQQDHASVKRIMASAHASCRDLYECSLPEIDKLVDIANSHRSCFGAKLTGAGWGGATVNLVQSIAISKFCEEVAEDYRKCTGCSATFLIAGRPAQGAAGFRRDVYANELPMRQHENARVL